MLYVGKETIDKLAEDLLIASCKLKSNGLLIRAEHSYDHKLAHDLIKISLAIIGGDLVEVEGTIHLNQGK